MIRVLIVDDSAMVREILREILSSDPEIKIVGEAENGKIAIELTKKTKPDIITMDIQMPEMDGFEATEYIMAYNPTPIIIFSSIIDKKETTSSLKAISLGALDVMIKPDITDDRFQSIAGSIISKVKSLAHIIVIPHIKKKMEDIHRTKKLIAASEKKIKNLNLDILLTNHNRINYKMIGIGASTGGPKALGKVLSEFPSDFPIGIVVVQHICEGFIESLAELLNTKLSLKVKIAENKEIISGGCVYIAPSNVQLLVDNEGRIVLNKNLSPWGVFKPSINHLFKSMGETLEEKGIGVILTGMGNDGTEGLETMYKKGAFTIAQDQKSSLIFGMPKTAIDKGVVTRVVSLADIAHEIKSITGYNYE